MNNGINALLRFSSWRFTVEKEWWWYSKRPIQENILNEVGMKEAQKKNINHEGVFTWIVRLPDIRLLQNPFFSYIHSYVSLWSSNYTQLCTLMHVDNLYIVNEVMLLPNKIFLIKWTDSWEMKIFISLFRFFHHP